MIYLLHSTVPLVRTNGVEVRHYIGQCKDERLLDRLGEHRAGKNSASTVRAFRKRGGILQLVAMWPGGTREDERRLKEARHYDEWCPICTPKKEHEHGWTGTARVYRLPGWSRRHLRKQHSGTSVPLTTADGGFRDGPF